jgi:hypothetical protein
MWHVWHVVCVNSCVFTPLLGIDACAERASPNAEIDEEGTFDTEVSVGGTFICRCCGTYD